MNVSFLPFWSYFFWLFAFFSASFRARVEAYTSVSVAVRSNPIVIDDRLFFIQSDGHITALNAKTGDLLQRKMDYELKEFKGTFTTDGERLYLVSEEELSVFDPKSLGLLWLQPCYDELIFVFNGLVITRMPRKIIATKAVTGKLAWEFESALDFDIQVFGDLVKTTSHDGKVRLLDTRNGNPIATNTLKLLGALKQPLVIKQFHPSFDEETYQLTSGTLVHAEISRNQVTGKNGRERREKLHILKYRSNQINWNSYISYNDSFERIKEYAIGYYGMIYAISTGGFVDCIDDKNGESRWVYAFPNRLETMSYSFPRGMPPSLWEMARNWDQRNKNKSAKSGTIRIPDTIVLTSQNFEKIRSLAQGRPVKATYDSMAENPFREKLNGLITIALAGSLLPTFASTAFVVAAIRSKKQISGRILLLISFAIFMISWVTFFVFPRVAPFTTALAKLAICSTWVVFLVICFREFRQHHRILGPCLGILSVGLLYWIHLALIYF